MTDPSATELTERARHLGAEAEHLYGVTKRRKDAARAARQQALGATGEASSDGAVRVTVDAGGMLTGLVLTAKALRKGPGDLAGLIAAVARQAAASARAAVRQVYEPLRDEGVVRELPVLLPESTAPAPPRPKDYEEEASFEERSITRRPGRG